MINIGGGLPVAYGEDVPTPEDVAQAVGHAVAEHMPYPIQLVAEPGRAVVAGAGALVAGVIGVARRGLTQWVHTDVGAFNGAFEVLQSRGQIRLPVALLRSYSDAVAGNCTITGPTCDSDDTIAVDAVLEGMPNYGDRLLVAQAGAYSLSYASNFNDFSIPVVVGRARTVVVPPQIHRGRGNTPEVAGQCEAVAD